MNVFFWGGGRPWQASEARSPENIREVSRNQGSELSNATIVPQGNAVADIEDTLNLIPENAAGTATPVGVPVCDWSMKAEQNSGVPCTKKAVPQRDISAELERSPSTMVLVTLPSEL